MVAEKERVAKIIELVHEEEQNKESTKINLFWGNSLAVQWVVVLPLPGARTKTNKQN